jgi:hypothetical protein
MVIVTVVALNCVVSFAVERSSTFPADVAHIASQGIFSTRVEFKVNDEARENFGPTRGADSRVNRKLPHHLQA